MKKIGLLLICTVMTAGLMFGQQDRQAIMEKVEARKVAFISSKLDLTPEEGQLFWPVYNAYHDELKALRKDNRAKGQFRDEENQDYDAMLDNLMEMQENELAVKKEYASKMKAAIGSRKTLMYYRVESQFKEDMLRELRGRRNRRSDK